MSTENKKLPAFEAFAIREGTNGRRNDWVKIGAVWPFKEGPGYTINLVAHPIDGKIVLMPPRPPKEQAEGEAQSDEPPFEDGYQN
jgi:hypothetical protein